MNLAQNDNLKALINTMYLGVTRTFFGLPFQHPFDVIKTKMQAKQTSLKDTVNSILVNKSIKGFYSGFWMNSLKIASKQVYRWPLMAYLTAYNEKILKFNQVQAAIVTSLVIALVDAVILCPFQRIKVTLMTSAEYMTFRNFFAVNSYQSLYQGFLSYFLKQTISWISFLGSTAEIKLRYRQIFEMTKEQQFSHRHIMEISLLVALINTGLLMPIDYIKTQAQKDGSKQAHIIKIMKHTYKQWGFKGFYVGWQMKLMQYMIHSFFTVSMMQQAINQFRRSFANKVSLTSQ